MSRRLGQRTGKLKREERPLMDWRCWKLGLRLCKKERRTKYCDVIGYLPAIARCIPARKKRQPLLLKMAAH